MVKTKIFKNGLKLVVDKMENYESVSFNMFVKVGSVCEEQGFYGIAHYIEHMLFKGTATRSSLDISKELDKIGANVNAYTDKEETVYYTKSTAENTEKCVEILSDMLFNSVFDKQEMAREKKVVLEEIKMYQDDAPSRAELLINQAFYSNNPFGRDVAGTMQSVKSLTREKILAFMHKYYVPQNITLSFAGNIDFETALKLVEKYFLPYFKQNGNDVKNDFETANNINVLKSFKDNAQSQVCISFAGVKRGDADLYVAKIFDVAFGVGMSSILFQRIREQLGLVYSIYSNTIANSAGGDMTIRFATTTKNVPLALTAIAEEIQKVKQNGLTDEQFENAKNNLISTIKLSFETTSFVSLFNAKNMAFDSKVITKEQYIKRVNAVKQKDILPYLNKTLVPNNFSISYVGDNTRLNLQKYFLIK
ncbi:MAG: M16 family metallopeptidase [Christensenellales bacterium]